MSRDASSTSWSSPAAEVLSPRRRVLLRGGLGAAAAGLFSLAGCGFRPLYAPVEAADGSQSDLVEELAAVRVGQIGERSGQLLRRDLQRRFEGSRPGTPARYALQVALSFSVEPLGYRGEGASTGRGTLRTAIWRS